MKIYNDNVPLQVTHDNVPQVLSQIQSDISIMKECMLKLNSTQSDSDKVFNLKELCEYLPDKPVPATVYGWKHRQMIPYIKGNGKGLMFRKSAIDAWLLAGRPKNKIEIVAKANDYLKTKKSNKKR